MTLMQVTIDVDALGKTIAEAADRIEELSRDVLPDDVLDRTELVERAGSTLKQLDYAQRELTSSSLLGKPA